MSVFRRLMSLASAAAAVSMAVSTAFAAPEGKFLAHPDSVVAIKAGRLYDSKSGQLLANQVIIIRGDKIVDVGPNVPVPAGAKVIDLSGSTVMPGMIDAHVHVTAGGQTPAQRAIYSVASAQLDLEAGFTTVKDMDSRGGFGTVDLRDLINKGLVMGPRMQVVGQSLNYRGHNYVTDPNSGKFYSGRTADKDLNGPDLARALVREAAYHGVDYIKIYSTHDFVGPYGIYKRDGTFQVFSSITVAEATAVVDEAHRLGLKVACHSYDGTANDPCLIAGVDEPNHLLQLDADGVRMIQQKHLIYLPTLDDLVTLDDEDQEASGKGGKTRLVMAEAAFRRAHAANIEMAFGSGATGPVAGGPASEGVPHGKQADQFAMYVKWGMTPREALAMTYSGAVHTLNYNMEQLIGSIDKGKFADIIAVAGNPLQDVTEMERVRFVMKGGIVVRDSASVGTPRSAP